MPLEVTFMELPPLGTNAYLWRDPERGEALLIDAPPGAADAVGDHLRHTGDRLIGVWLTHGHWDHLVDAALFAAQGIPVWAHAGDKMLIEDPERMASYSMPGIRMRPVRVARWLQHAERLSLWGREIEVRHVPGHSPGSILFYFEEEGVACSGDVVFAGGVGRTDLPLASFEELERSIRNQVYSLPEDTVLLPGHGEPTTVADERKSNPFVSG